MDDYPSLRPALDVIERWRRVADRYRLCYEIALIAACLLAVTTFILYLEARKCWVTSALW